MYFTDEENEASSKRYLQQLEKKSKRDREISGDNILIGLLVAAVIFALMFVVVQVKTNLPDMNLDIPVKITVEYKDSTVGK